MTRRARVEPAMLSVLLLSTFVARQFWGWLSDRVGGLWTVFIGGLAQTVGMLGFLATQDEAGLFFAAAAYGLGFGGIVPAYVLAARELFPSIEASWRVPALLMRSLAGMAFGAWLAGAIYDGMGFYPAAWWVGIVFGLAQVALRGRSCRPAPTNADDRCLAAADTGLVRRQFLPDSQNQLLNEGVR